MTAPDNTLCAQCKSPGTLGKRVRPYGPGQTMICFECAHDDAELLAIAEMYERRDIEQRTRARAAEIHKAFPGAKVIELDAASLRKAIEDNTFMTLLARALDISRPKDETGSDDCTCPECTLHRLSRAALVAAAGAN